MKEKLNGKSDLSCTSLLLILGLTIIVGGNSTNVKAQTRPEIRLVLQITVDGLRADLLNRYRAGFGKDGFRYLLQQGTVYTNAQYQHANTETIVGHATLATGTTQSTHHPFR